MLENIIKEDLTMISQLTNEDVMDKLDLDEDSAEAVKDACRAWVKSNLGKQVNRQRKEFNFGRRSARVTKGGSFR